MIHIAKMHTRYPEYHGTGYYNFLIDTDRDRLDDRIEDMSHDFGLVKVVKTRHDSVEAVMKTYPSKEELNDKYFKSDILRG